MKPRSGLQIYLRPRMTLTFDVQTLKDSKLIVSRAGRVDHLCQFAWFPRFQNVVFTSLVTDERTDGRTYRWTDGRTTPRT